MCHVGPFPGLLKHQLINVMLELRNALGSFDKLRPDLPIGDFNPHSLIAELIDAFNVLSRSVKFGRRTSEYLQSLRFS